MKLTKYRRLTAGVLLVGAGALGLLSGPAIAHNQNGNPDLTNPGDPNQPPGLQRHDVTISKAVSLVRSKTDPCSFNTPVAGHTYGPACSTPSIVNVSAPAFNGDPGQGVTVILCNGKRAAPTDQGGDNDATGGCDIANARGLSSVPGFPASSGTFTLDGSGDLPGTIPLTLTSCNTSGAVPDLLTQFGGPTCNNANTSTTCPPTQGQISNGFTCIVPVAEFDPVALTAGAHVGFRTVYLKSPIPSKLCDPPGGPVTFGACGTTIPSGTGVKLTGVRFPCKVIRPDDPGVPGGDGACITGWGNKTILMKRSSTGLLEGVAITPSSQSTGLNGDYVVTFTMPTLLHPTEIYKIVPHAVDCSPNQYGQGNSGFLSPNNWIVNSCESGKFNAAGVTFKQA